MRYFAFIMSVSVIVGCTGDRSDLESFVTTTKAEYVGYIPPLKEAPRFQHFNYQGELHRSPFMPPSRELTEEIIDTTKDCLQPDLRRRKSRLETYALDNLEMRGSLTEGNNTWALVQSSDGGVYRLGVGDYIGLYHGKIAVVTASNIAITELVPDGTGCWTERNSNMELSGE